MERFQIYYPGLGDNECLALTLVNHLDRELDGSADGATLRRDLETQYLALYGRPLLPGPVPVWPAVPAARCDATS